MPLNFYHPVQPVQLIVSLQKDGSIESMLADDLAYKTLTARTDLASHEITLKRSSWGNGAASLDEIPTESFVFKFPREHLFYILFKSVKAQIVSSLCI